jgi:UDP-N-acetylglucosamine 2-epimerase (non-hydrolysing)
VRRAHVAVVMGTRPEAIKLAPLVVAMRTDPRLTVSIISTAQHRVMLDQVLRLFRLRADVDLDLLGSAPGLNGLAARALTGIDSAFSDLCPDMVIVQGDTLTTFVGAVAAFHRQIPVVHLEAGLRSDNLSSPFPEEGNRRMVGQIASWHLCATGANADRLIAEGVHPERVLVTGNTVIDALHSVVADRPTIQNPVVAALLGGAGDRVRLPRRRQLVTVTAHRRESWGEPLRQIALAVNDVCMDAAERLADVDVVWPLHGNPAVAAEVVPVLGTTPGVHLIEPLDYSDFAQLLAASDLVISDSGGVQEECPALGVPVLVARDVTERHEAVDCGAAVLVGTDRQRIFSAARRSLACGTRRVVASPYGDGRAADRASALVRHALFGDARPANFVVEIGGRSFQRSA